MASSASRPLPLRRALQAAVVEEHLQGLTLHKAIRRFRRSRTRDALGWTSNTFSEVLQHANGRMAIIGILRRTWLHETSPLVCQLIGMTQSVALVKDNTGASRPIAIPSMFRKLQANEAQRGDTTFFGGRTIRGSHGEWCNQVWLVGTATNACPESSYVPSNRYIECVRRTAPPQVLAGFQEISHELADLVGAWLAQPMPALIDTGLGEGRVVYTHRGVPQGDPFSTYASCVGMKLVQRQFEATAPPTPKWAGYIDDTVLMCANEDLDRTWEAFQNATARAGLQVNDAKTKLWSPSGQIPPHWQNKAVDGGTHICGYPVWHTTAEDYRDASTPFGTNEHLRNFLTQHAQDWHRRLEVLQRLIEVLGPNTTALRNALRLMHASLLKRHLRLFRVLPWAVLRGWAQELDDSVVRFMSTTLNVDAWPLSATHVLRGPIAAGGLGFASLVDEVSVNFLAGSLALRFHSHNNHQEEPWPPGFDEAQGDYERITGSMPHRALEMTQMEYDQGHAHAGRGLRKLWLTVQRTRAYRKRFPNMLVKSMRRSSLDHAQREAATLTSAWLHGWRGPGMYAAPLDPRSRCSYIYRNTGRVCAARMDEHGVHIGTCAFAGRIMRHNLVRDQIAEIAIEAGFGVQREQEVECGRMVAAPETHKRADLRITSVAGASYAIDVTICSTRDAQGTTARNLGIGENNKFGAYGVTRGAPMV